MQLIVTLLFGLILGLLMGAGVGIYVLARRFRRPAITGDAPRRLSTHIQVRRDDAWFRGDDLLRHPRRLAELQNRLLEQHLAALAQAAHLAERREELEVRPDREELAKRYTEDERVLHRRAERMSRVLGVVWKARALLGLRAHVAITARRRPALTSLPEGDVAVESLPAAAKAYDQASDAVRAFVSELDSRANDLDDVISPAPTQAVVTDTIRMAVEGERMHTLQTYSAMRERMDELADTLGYLADRCRTRVVVEGGPRELGSVEVGAADGSLGSEGLVEELNRALSGMADLAEVGDRRLADAAMDKLAEEISLLEKAGLDAQAETDAVLEVQRLIEQYGSKT